MTSEEAKKDTYDELCRTGAMDLVVEIDRASAAGLSDGASARCRRGQFPVQALVGRVGDDFSGG